MSFFTEISQVLFDFQNKNGKALDPSRVTKCIIKTARKEARSWGSDSKPEIPNHFLVMVGTEDWNAYYGQRPEDIANEVAYHVMRAAHGKGLYLASDPVVTFAENPTIPKGRCSVSAHFNFEERERLRKEPMADVLREEPQEEVSVQEHAEAEAAAEEPRREFPVQQPTTVLSPIGTVAEQDPVPTPTSAQASPAQASPALVTEPEPEPKTEPQSAAVTTVMKPPSETSLIAKVEETALEPTAPEMTEILQKPIVPEAFLEASGHSLRVFHECTVGVVRKPEAEVQPDVVLPYGQFPYVSHIQGKFAFVDGAWRFLNVGRNGTRVQTQDQDIMLEPGMNCVVPFDSWITFAEGLPLRFAKTQQ